MAILTRFARLVRADIHELLDRLEEPDVLLRQAIRDMEEQITDDEAHVRRSHAALARQRNRRSELNVTLGRTSEELDICLGADKDDFARELVRRRLENQRLLEQVEHEIGQTEQMLAGQQRQLDQRTAQLDRVRNQAQGLLREASSPPTPEMTKQHCGVSDTDVEVALLRERQRRAS